MGKQLLSGANLQRAPRLYYFFQVQVLLLLTKITYTVLMYELLSSLNVIEFE